MRVIIGLETHLQLRSKSKLFCSCPTEKYREEPPNSVVCPVCAAQPGSKPWGVNEEALKNALRIAVALNCKVKTDEPIYVQRKNYFYPDLPSGYQRTSTPLGVDGELAGVRIREVHIEEDPGRYDLKSGRVDFNRSGIPLVEIVTEPDIKSPDHARQYLEELQGVLNYLNAAREEAGSERVDANLSYEGHPRIEVKNINSFKGVFTALTYETTRQKTLIDKGIHYVQETRHFDEAQGTTLGLRKKETVSDYRYFPDPDVPPIVIPKKLVEETRKGIPELPAAKRKRLVKQYGLTEQDAFAVSLEPEFVDAFEHVSKEVEARKAAFFMLGVLRKQLNYRGLRLKDSKLLPRHVVELIKMVSAGEVTDKVAEQMLVVFLDKGIPADIRKHAQETGLLGVKAGKELEGFVESVVNENDKAVKDYLGGNEKALHFLAGKIMALTKGKASPEEVHRLLKKRVGK